MSFRKQTPSEFLKLIIGKPVVVKLNSGVDYRGGLQYWGGGGGGGADSWWALYGTSLFQEFWLVWMDT